MKKIMIIALGLVVLTTGACKKYLDKYEVSPNSPSEVTPSLLLTLSEVVTFSVYNGQLSREAAILTQQGAGVQFQFQDIENYAIFEGDNTNDWRTIYSDGLINEQKLIDLSGDANPYYRGMARVLKAMMLGIATDFWGDVPNSEALKGLNGSAGWSPKYDAQEAVIADIQTLLSSAITDLSTTPDKNVYLPGSDDVIFNGDPAKWIKAAWVLKARYANRLSKRDPNSATNVLSYLSNAGMTGSSDDMMAVFGTNGNELNPWYAFQNQRGQYLKMGANLVNMMNGQNDPRVPFYFTQDISGAYSGTVVGSGVDTTSDIGPYYSSASSPLPLVTFVESKFLKAEAEFSKGDKINAAKDYNEAIIAHVTLVTGAAPDSAFNASVCSETDATITWEKIMNQKYICMFTQPEVFADWRRTGFPKLTPNPNGITSGIPRRLPTSLDERVNNPNATVVQDVLKPVWWDQ